MKLSLTQKGHNAKNLTGKGIFARDPELAQRASKKGVLVKRFKEEEIKKKFGVAREFLKNEILDPEKNRATLKIVWKRLQEAAQGKIRLTNEECRVLELYLAYVLGRPTDMQYTVTEGTLRVVFE